jgi:adenosylcobinamide-GDP ribazoletransferase
VNFVRREFRALWAALIFFTRVPLPALPSSTPGDWQRAATYFPVIGYLVGGGIAVIWWSASLVFPPTVASGLSLAGGILLTGAMHEDGLADCCDGFGGGWTKEKILEIMRDSRIGAFGVIALILTFGLKWQTIASLPRVLVPALLIAGQTLSRSGAISLMSALDYAGSEEGKARPLSSRMGTARLLATFLFGCAPLAFLSLRLWWAGVSVLIVRLVAERWFRRRIGGYTGDCLGAVQQIGELVFLVTALALV